MSVEYYLPLIRAMRSLSDSINTFLKSKEKSKIIQGYRILIDFTKMKREYYKALISLNNPLKKQEESIYTFLSSHNVVVYLIEILGSWHLEIEAKVENSDQMTLLIRDFRNKYPDLIADYNIVKVIKEHVLNYFPYEKINKTMK